MHRMSVASLTVGLLVAGCAADSTILQSALVMESAYEPLTCAEVVGKYKGAEARVKELTALMEKSGSPIANALAYDSEYTAAKANQRYAARAAERKGCDLGNKPPPPPAVQAQPLPLGPEPPGTTQAQQKKQ
jgi:hypothetical protein